MRHAAVMSNRNDPAAIAAYRLAGTPAERFLEARSAALAADDPGLAAGILELAREAGYVIEGPETATPSRFDRARRYLREASRGAVRGDVSTPASAAGAVASDLVGIGDVRDLITQGVAAGSGRDYDPVVLGLAAVGLLLTASSIASLGAIGPADAGAAILKNAQKAGALSPALRAQLAAMSGRLIDAEKLRDVMRAASAADIAVNPRLLLVAIRADQAGELRSVARSVGEIARHADIATATRAARYAEEAADLARIERIAERYRGGTRAVFAVLGRSAIAAGGFLPASVLWLGGALVALLVNLVAGMLVIRTLLGIVRGGWRAVRLRRG